MTELQHHAAFSAWLAKNNILHVHCRTDQKATIAVGWPDYTIFIAGQEGPEVVLIEFKQKGKKPDQDQVKIITRLRAIGFDAFVMYDSESAIRYIESMMGTRAATEASQAPAAPASEKLYLIHSGNIGDMVVRRGSDGWAEFVRMPTEADRATLPRWK